MRISISAQSWASVPPVPAWKVRMALLAVQHRHQLQFVDGFLNSLNGLFALGGQCGIVLLLDHLEQGLGFLVLGGQFAETLELVLHFAHLADDLLAAGLVIVKAGQSHLMLQLGQTLLAGFDRKCIAQVIYRGFHSPEFCF